MDSSLASGVRGVRTATRRRSPRSRRLVRSFRTPFRWTWSVLVRLSLHRAILGTVVATILVSVVPAGIALDRRLVAELVTRERSDLEMAAAMVAGGTMRAAAEPA